MVQLTRTKAPRVLPGSLITLRRKCGKAGCRCASGEPHETPALSYSVAGRTKMLTLKPDEVSPVASAVLRYRKAINSLEEEARGVLIALVETVKARRSSEKR